MGGAVKVKRGCDHTSEIELPYMLGLFLSYIFKVVQGGVRWCIPYNTIRIFPNLTQTAPFILVSDHSSYFLHWPSLVRVPKEYSIACLQKDPSTRQANVLHMSMHSLLYSPRILQNVFDFTLSFHHNTCSYTHVD